MKNSYLIRNLGPNLLQDHSLRHHSSLLGSLFQSVVFWCAVLALLSWVGYGVAHSQSVDSDPMVMKIYPDGTKLILRWSEVGNKVDHGEKFGGAPRIVAYDPSKEGIVPIGEASKKTETTTSTAAIPTPSSVLTPDQPAKMDYTDADPKDYVEKFGPMEGFGFRTSVGPAFQQSVSYRDISSTTSSSRYNKLTFSPGIRFDLEPFYNINDWFAVGIQSAFIYNQIHSISTGNTTSYFNTSANGNASYYQIPILLNFRFQFPSEGPVRGYVTGAPGGVWDFSTLSTGGQNFTSYQWNYAFQLGAGLIYNMAPGLDLDTSFKMLCTPNPLSENAEGPVKASYNYAATVGLVWRF